MPSCHKSRLLLQHQLSPVVFFCIVLFTGSVNSMPQTPKSTADTQTVQPAKPKTGDPQSQMGSVNTGTPHAAVLDKEHRPITAGGFVKTGPILFQDIAQKAGLTTWKHTMGAPEKNYILESNGSGVGLIDYDNDGWLDIYLVNGSTADAYQR